jgi:hypothetical protein
MYKYLFTLIYEYVHIHISIYICIDTYTPINIYISQHLCIYSYTLISISTTLKMLYSWEGSFTNATLYVKF